MIEAPTNRMGKRLMSYSRWGNSRFYTFWSAADDGAETMDGQTFEVDCRAKATYGEMAQDFNRTLDLLIIEVEREKAGTTTAEEREELAGYMRAFMADVVNDDAAGRDWTDRHWQRPPLGSGDKTVDKETAMGESDKLVKCICGGTGQMQTFGGYRFACHLCSRSDPANRERSVRQATATWNEMQRASRVIIAAKAWKIARDKNCRHYATLEESQGMDVQFSETCSKLNDAVEAIGDPPV